RAGPAGAAPRGEGRARGAAGAPPQPRALAQEAPADLADLGARLLRRDPRDRPTGAEVLRRLDAVRPAAAPAPPPAPAGLEVPLVGRQGHLQALEAAFEAMRLGRTVMLALHGPSGSGKTALLRCILEPL